MSVAVDAPATILFSLFYFIFCLGFVYQSKECVGLGLTVENLLTFRDWVGSEEISFVQYQIRRTSGTLILHSLLPFGYFVGYSYVTTQVDGNYTTMEEFWRHWPQFWNILLLSILIPTTLFSLIWYWSLTDWEFHPVVEKLKIYSPENWKPLAADLNTEFRRIDKICVNTNPMERFLVTDNWIILLGAWPWSFHISHQSDSSINILSSDDHSISTEGELGGAQYLHLQVMSRKPGVKSFSFRMNSLEYQNLQTKLTGQIENIRNVQIYKTVSERFVDVFKQTVAQNEKVTVNDELEPCIGCMMVTANVKLMRVCDSSRVEGGGEDKCVNCYCRPMWCVDCLGKWFASRQNQAEPETWLGSRCPCPSCRSKFCVLDVCMLQ